jgi:hypothetical protein
MKDVAEVESARATTASPNPKAPIPKQIRYIIGNLWVLIANAGVQNPAATKFVASTGFGVTAFQMFFFAEFAFAAPLVFGFVARA